MDAEAEARVAKLARDFLLEIARERSLEAVFGKIQAKIAEAPLVEFFRIWLIESGDRCTRCVWRRQCPDQTRCLHSVAGGNGGSTEKLVDYEFVDSFLARIPIGTGVIGGIAANGQEVVIRRNAGDIDELARLDSAKRARLQLFNGAPIIFKDEVLGVIGVFGQWDLEPETMSVWVRLVADHIAGAIVNARAFREIERLRDQLELENANLKEQVEEAKAFGELVGQSESLRRIVSQIDLVAPTDATVLILGESGTGKELVAREIHLRSRRKDKPMIRVNCASIPKELFESEFFGHSKGAFTGAIKDRAGRFEAAQGGTLFLDEVGEIPLDLQGKLLRVLQERKYERVGEERTRDADVRIIAATNRDLKRDVAGGRFREDLYYRLSVFPILVAPLKERKEDIPALAHHFVTISMRELGCKKPRLTRAGIHKLQDYDWPGNIRELRNVIEHAAILAHGGVLEFDLPRGDALQPSASLPSPDLQVGEPEFLTEIELRKREQENLLAVLNKARWKIKGADGAAELLGVKPTTLMTRIKKMKLKRPSRLAEP